MECAANGAFFPVWSQRILEEWRHAAKRNGIGPLASIEIALLQSNWPKSDVDFPVDLEESIHLLDANDRHVVAAAISGEAKELLTLNTKDFPIRTLSSHGLQRRHPDEFLLEIAQKHPELVCRAIDKVHKKAEEFDSAKVNRLKMLKKANLPRLAKWDKQQAG